jgi:hypothetical protein
MEKLTDNCIYDGMISSSVTVNFIKIVCFKLSRRGTFFVTQHKESCYRSEKFPNIWIHNTLIMFVVLCGCQMWCFYSEQRTRITNI